MATRSLASVNKFGATIANGAAVSNAIPFDTARSIAIVLPAAWTAAALEFETTIDDINWVAVVDDASVAVSIPDATIQAQLGRAVVQATILNKLLPLRSIRLASGPAAARVNQGAARSFTVITKS